MGITLDDLKNVWFGITNPQHWSNMMGEFGSVAPAIANAKDRLSSGLGLNTGGPASPISGPPPTLGEVWQKLNSALNTKTSQPANNSGSSR